MSRERLRTVLINQRKTYWPKENLARAKYYFSLVLDATAADQPPSVPLHPSNLSLTSSYSSAVRREGRENMSRSDVAALFRNEAIAVRDELLPLSQQQALLSGTATGEAKDAILFNYMAPWGYRVVVQQIPDYLTALSMCDSAVAEA